MQVELRLNAAVDCADGPAGRLTDLVLDPVTERVTHLVVETRGFGHPQHLVPVALLAPRTGREVHLRCLRAELAHTEFFTETESVPLDASDAWYVADGALAWPLAFPRVARRLAEHQRVPPGELALRQDTAVEAIDGPVGQLAAFVVRSNDDRVVDIVVRRGHLWRKRDVVIPATSIDSIDARVVHLRVPKALVQLLPASPPWSAA